MKTTICNKISMLVLLSLLCLMSMSCRDSNDTQKQTSSDNALPDSLFLSEEPTGIQGISSLKDKAKEGDNVVIKAVVGGRKKVFVSSRAVITVIDASVENPCLKEDGHCAKPWDYCCSPSEQLLSNMASVHILGADNRPLVIDLNTVENFKPLTTLVIRGTVGPRTDKTSLVINATGIFVVPKESKGK